MLVHRKGIQGSCWTQSCACRHGDTHLQAQAIERRAETLPLRIFMHRHKLSFECSAQPVLQQCFIDVETLVDAGKCIDCLSLLLRELAQAWPPALATLQTAFCYISVCVWKLVWPLMTQAARAKPDYFQPHASATYGGALQQQSGRKQANQ